MRYLIVLASLAACLRSPPPPKYAAAALEIPSWNEEALNMKPLLIRDITLHLETTLAFHNRNCELHLSGNAGSREYSFDGWPDEHSGTLLGPDTCPAVDAHEAPAASSSRATTTGSHCSRLARRR
jgi:hypothetical protein